MQIQQLNRLLTKTAQGSPAGAGLLPIMAFVVRLRPKGVPFSCFRYMKGSVCCWFSSLPIGSSLGAPVFPSPQKPTFANSNSIRNAGTRLSEFLTTSQCCVAKQITDYNVSYLFFKTNTLVTYKLTLPFDLNGF